MSLVEIGQSKKPTLNPKKLMNYFYNKVDVKTAAVVIFFSIIIEILFLVILGYPYAGKYLLSSIVNKFILSWILLGGLIYLIAYFIRSSKYIKKDTFYKILSGLSALKIINIFFVLILALITLIFLPKWIPFISISFTNPLFLQNIILPMNGWIYVGLFLVFALLISLIVYVILSIYQLIGEVFNTKSSAKKSLYTLLLIIILGLISLI